MEHLNFRTIKIVGFLIVALFSVCTYDGTKQATQSAIILEYNAMLIPRARNIEKLMSEYDEMANGPDFKLIAYLKRVLPQVREEIDKLKAIDFKSPELDIVRQRLVDSLEADGKLFSTLGRLLMNKPGVTKDDIDKARQESDRCTALFIQARDQMIKKNDLKLNN